MKKKVFFITKDQVLRQLEEAGQNPAGRIEYLLGYNLLDEDKYEKSFANLPRGEVKGLVGTICHLIEWPFRKIVRIGIAFEVYPFLSKQIKAAEVIVCINDGIGLGLCFWKMLGLVKADVIVMMMGLPEKYRNLKGHPLLRFFISKILGRAAYILTLSDCARVSLRDYFHLKTERISTFRFGTNTDYWRPLTEVRRENFILSVGNDRNRDFPTLINALPDNLALKIITKIPIKTDKPNVEIINDFLSGDALIKLYNQAFFAVIPSIKLREESAGLSSDLQLMASNTAVIISRAQAIEEIFIDGVDCLFYEPENAPDLQKKIKALLDNNALRDKITEGGRREVLTTYNCQSMAKQMEKLIDSL
jgi:glycosyltransferase involved in cell wall biosynthesis